MPTPQPVTSLHDLPVMLTLDDLVGIYRKGKSTIRRELAAGTFEPKPITTDPYRWLRSAVIAHFEKLDRVLRERAARLPTTAGKPVRLTRRGRPPRKQTA